MSSTTANATAAPLSIPGLDLQEKVGEGGMSAVYRGVHRNLQRPVAVKIMRATVEEGAESPRWLRESRLMASLAHPHVVAIHDAGQVEGHNYLVMEHMAGGSMRARMKPGEPWPLPEATALLNDIAQALGHIHKQGVLHLDLKPENILYAADGQVKITDFGLSIPHADAGALLGGRRFQGTLDYCAPEYRSGLALDERYDVFSLATLAYELFTGRIPGRVYVPATRRNPQLPAALDAVLQRGLARDPHERYASIAEFQQALNAAGRPAAPRRMGRIVGVSAAAAALVIIPLALYKWWPAAQQSIGTRAPESPVVEAPNSERPDRLVVFYDRPEDVSLFAGEDGAELASGSSTTLERFAAEEFSRQLPPGLPLAAWPTPSPALVIRSPGAWGFVHPFRDRALGQRVLAHWPDLLRTVVPPEKNFTRAGDFDGNCLASGGALWRTGSRTEDWNANRHISLDRNADGPENSALLLTNLDPDRAKARLRCYQPIRKDPPPGGIVVLRYRARSLQGKGTLSVNAALPAEIPEGDTSLAANRVRDLGAPAPDDPDNALPKRWHYWCAASVTPPAQWQRFLVVFEAPPFPTRAMHRNLIIDVSAIGPTATDKIWVDDVELFIWQPGTKP